ncbi:MAG: DUF2723 domain-containing protein [Actinobacteria bacterium]|nr:DUF2723 domain-containing protein [Actinomycetota bacterium]
MKKDIYDTGQGKFKKFILSNKAKIYAFFSFLIPFIFYILTLEHKLVGGDTTWYALKILKMEVFVPTGYPTFSLLGKAITYLPVGDLAYRLNLFSAVFGALTVLFLFLTINALIKKDWISFFSSLCFAFIFPFWYVANRLEFDTLNTFFIILVIYAAVKYQQVLNRKYLYFFFFSLGLSLTNHPIAFFTVPALLLYVIIINPKIFKSIKVILSSVFFFVLPLLSYLYLPVRSLMGYGEVTDFRRFIYYITGRSITGQVHGGSFGDKSLEVVAKVLKEYTKIIYENFGIVLIIISIVGFIYLIKKNLKLGICSLLLIVFNFAIIIQYLDFANPNYVLDSMLVITIYIAYGFLFIIDLLEFIFERLLAGKKQIKADIILKNLIFIVIFLFFAFQPVSLIYANYNEADLSEPEPVYKFWNEAFGNMEDKSRVYVQAYSANIGMFVNKYEYGEKGIEYIYQNDKKYSIENMKEDFNKNYKVYFVGNKDLIKSFFKVEQIGKTYYFDWYRENLKLFKVTGLKVNIEINYNIGSHYKNFGEEFTLEYIIKNLNEEEIKIDSLELELPDSIEFIGVEPDGYINQGPGISRGMYMWVSDDYKIDGGSKINLKINLRGIVPGKSVIKFRITANNNYINCEDIEIEIES